MAGILRNAVRGFSSQLSRQSLFASVKHGEHVLGCAPRTLYTDAYLNIEGFNENRKRVETQFGHMRAKFFERMKENISPENKEAMVFTEDLKNVTYLISDKPDEVELLVSMIKKFNSQNKDLRFGAFVFGPVIMRLLHVFRDPNTAFQLIQDEECRGFFDQLSTYLVVADLLFKEMRYQEVLDLWQIMSQSHFDQKFPRDIAVLLMASCYKLNTPESFKFALECMKTARESGSQVLRRAIAFFAALAVKQNSAAAGIEVLSLANGNHIAIRNLRTIALAQIGRAEDALIELRAVLNRDVPAHFIQRGDILPETLTAVGNALNEKGSKELLKEFEQTIKALNEGKHVQETTLETILLEPIEGYNKRQPGQNSANQQFSNQRYAARSFRPSGSIQNQRPARRGGLSDID